VSNVLQGQIVDCAVLEIHVMEIASL
jgi:hypothetical protein